MDVCNLVYLLQQNNGRLRHCIVSGYLTREMERPSTLQENVETSINGKFVEMDCCTIEFKQEDYVKSALGTGNKDKVYLIKGKLCTFVHSYIKLGDIYAIEGNVATASREATNLVALFNFKKVRKHWSIEPFDAKNVDVTNWGKSTRPYYYVNLSYDKGKIIVPEDMVEMADFISEREQGNNSNIDKFQYTMPDMENRVSKIEKDIPVERVKEVGREVFERSILVPKNDKVYDDLCNAKDMADSHREVQIETLQGKFGYAEDLSYIQALINRLKTQWNHGGKGVLSEYIGTADGSNVEYLGTTVRKYLLTIKDELLSYVLNGDTVLTAHGQALKIARQLFRNPEQFYAGVVGRIIGKDLSKAAEYCEECEISFSKLINESPYTLIIFNPSMSFEEIEYIAMCFKKAGLADTRRQRNVCMITDYLLHSNGNATVYQLNDVKKTRFSVRLTQNQYNLVQARGTYLSNKVVERINKFLGLDLLDYSEGYQSDTFRKYGSYYYSYATAGEITSACRDVVSSGTGVIFLRDNIEYIASLGLFKKELFIYNKLYNLASQFKYIRQEVIEEEIERFERLKGFKLEEEQRKGVSLIGHNAFAVYGVAGGGKTTLAELLVNILQREYGEGYKVQYAAPTGIASKRLSESVKERARTMHSLFRIGETAPLFSDNEEFDDSDTADCYILDEMSMVTSDLLYQILRKVNQPKIIFLGDISQLAPIGKGMPFKDILHMLPCCTLNVGKRCLESSYIAENNDIIINSIDTPLAIGQDFQTLVCSEEEMQQTVLNSVKGLLGITGQQPVGTRLYKATEVQVISPVVKPNYIWGTYQLNRALQPVFTPKPKFKFKYDTQEGIEYREGDRVLHKENNNKFLHYQRIDEHTFQKTCEYGLVNGDIGYIRSVIKADQLKLLEVAEGDKADYEEIAETIRDDSLYITDKEAYFVAIEYDGFYALYLAYEDTEENVVKSKDMKALDLAYALTVHKLQGSSAACIVFVIGKIPYNNTFINRNLIYTGVSRARESELLIGDVSNGRNSTLSKGRRIKQQENVETVMSLLYREG